MIPRRRDDRDESSGRRSGGGLKSIVPVTGNVADPAGSPKPSAANFFPEITGGTTRLGRAPLLAGIILLRKGYFANHGDCDSKLSDRIQSTPPSLPPLRPREAVDNDGDFVPLVSRSRYRGAYLHLLFNSPKK